MEVFAIPVEGKFIVYRPLRQLAFIGNRAMASLALDAAAAGVNPNDDGPGEALQYLGRIGFLAPDPEPPPPPDPLFQPTMAVLLLTNRCQLRCVYCYADAGTGSPVEMPIGIACTAIDFAHENAQRLGHARFEVSFHGGGEPTQAWNVLQEAVAHARAKPLPCGVSITTNGVWSERQLRWILENVDSATLSVDGTEETQDHQRPYASGRGSHQTVKRTVSHLDRAGFEYGFRMTAIAPWRERLPRDVAFLCDETGCRYMQVEPAFNTRRGEHRGPTLAEGEAFVDAFMEAFEIACRAGRRLTYSGARPWLVTQAFCTAPYGALIAAADGRLVGCYEIASDSHPLAEMSTVGRVTTDHVLPDERRRAALLDHIERKRATCRKCFCFWQCAGDCYTRAHFTEASGGEQVQPRCHMNREITSRILLYYIMAGDGVWQGQGQDPQEAQLFKAF